MNRTQPTIVQTTEGLINLASVIMVARNFKNNIKLFSDTNDETTHIELDSYLDSDFIEKLEHYAIYEKQDIEGKIFVRLLQCRFYFNLWKIKRATFSLHSEEEQLTIYFNPAGFLILKNEEAKRFRELLPMLPIKIELQGN
ncbi:hypothetical protein NG798_27745 [Ancylothrix sp. C2]|uniref:hypothetical protein n=1 Tax=Ancylothrix sp. D3o TaxID=2953691 RepID=UPI0021BA8EC8|nr:hypothetical protein [Ancylothrix sp. D3o]MCT7953595.1 hypothetical protein [Ancylothrix sp. D3o]